MTFILAIDPGKSGGYAKFHRETKKLITAGRLNFDKPHDIFDLAFDADMTVIERAQAAPKQGVSTSFEYGRAFGRTEAAVMLATGGEIFYMSSSWWKGKLGIPTDKKKAVQIALKMIPGLDKFVTLESDDGVAEAALMAQIIMNDKYLSDLRLNNVRREKPKKRRASFTWDEPPAT